ncbi:hypothetical protein MHU86_14495 [Fragilaria crotonensis]|nr:hypothetical protein MHU86_14495 [Fragilaria crotonensis]
MDSDEGKVTLISKEGVSFTVDANVAKMSKIVEDTVDGEDDGEDHEIQLPNVKSTVLAKVIEYCEHYQTEEMTPIATPLKSSKIEDMVQPFYAEFVKLDQNMLFELVTAANFMDIKPLLDLACLAVSIMIKGKSAEELRSNPPAGIIFTMPDADNRKQQLNAVQSAFSMCLIAIPLLILFEHNLQSKKRVVVGNIFVSRDDSPSDSHS